MNELVGTYKFEEQTAVTTTSSTQFQNATITLYADSTFQASNMPDFNRSMEFKLHEFVTAKGKWNIDTNGSVANGTGSPDSIWGMDLTGMPESLSHIEFMGNKPPYKLIVTYGDPDGGAVLILHRK